MAKVTRPRTLAELEAEIDLHRSALRAAQEVNEANRERLYELERFAIELRELTGAESFANIVEHVRALHRSNGGNDS